jgi:hypothetical protein
MTKQDCARVFVGCAANNEDLESQAVFEYSLRKHSSIPVDITWMQLSRDPKSPFYSDPEKGLGWRTKQWATPFSGFRWAISTLCGLEGRGIYFDSDFIIMGDIAELWRQKMPSGKVVVAKGAKAGTRYCCSMWDCAEFPLIPGWKGWEWLRSDENAHNNMCYKFQSNIRLVEEFGIGDWNVLDTGFPQDFYQPWIKAIHYTMIPTQLQLPHAIPRLEREGGKHWFEGRPKPHPRGDLQAYFDMLLQEAYKAGYTLDKYRREPYGRYSIRGK